MVMNETKRASCKWNEESVEERRERLQKKDIEAFNQSIIDYCMSSSPDDKGNGILDRIELLNPCKGHEYIVQQDRHGFPYQVCVNCGNKQFRFETQ